MSRDRQITLSEASRLEVKAVFLKYETRMMIAIEQAKRNAHRNGLEQLKAVAQDQQVLTLFTEVVEASSRAGLGWLAIANAFTRIKDSGLAGQAGDINSQIERHCKLARAEADDWLCSLVVKVVPGVRRRATS